MVKPGFVLDDGTKQERRVYIICMALRTEAVVSHAQPLLDLFGKPLAKCSDIDYKYKHMKIII